MFFRRKWIEFKLQKIPSVSVCRQTYIVRRIFSSTICTVYNRSFFEGFSILGRLSKSLNKFLKKSLRKVWGLMFFCRKCIEIIFFQKSSITFRRGNRILRRFFSSSIFRRSSSAPYTNRFIKPSRYALNNCFKQVQAQGGQIQTCTCSLLQSLSKKPLWQRSKIKYTNYYNHVCVRTLTWLYFIQFFFALIWI